MSLYDGYEILAATCHDNHCPTLVRDPATGRIGIGGSISSAPGEKREHIAWMSPDEWAALSSGSGRA